MGFLGILVQVTWVAVMLSELAAAAIAFPIALPNCPDKCGDVEIPYPFGLTKGCSIDQNFLINCTNSFGPTQPFLLGNLTATNFSLEGQANILMYIAKDCYKHGVLDLSIEVDLDLGLNFAISNTQNEFIVVGCDTYAYFDFQQDKENFSIGCNSVCGSTRFMVNGSCSGVGCCKVDIPNGLNYIKLEPYSLNNHTKVGAFNPCGYAFISQQTMFNFSIDSLHSLRHREMTPVVLDWVIGTETCKDVVNKSGYKCGGNSTCIDSDNGSGYRCKCKEGYHGNPYLYFGCQDINECKNHNPCKLPGQKCINGPGNFTCSCIKGYHLDVSAGAGICVTNQSSRLVTLLVGIITSNIGGLALLIIMWRLYKMKKKRNEIKLKKRYFKRNGGLLLQQQLSSSSSSEHNIQHTKLFTSKELEKATDQFNESRILGKGGQGIVYKGMLTDGSITAIKKCNIVDEGNLEQFINEIIILSQINHRNVVKLVGCCLETEIPLLVYEFIPKGTLSQYLHEESEEFPLTWDMRLRIAKEVAGALSYLHSAASLPIYHRDIKSTNILLDDKYRAKVADFGISRSVNIDQTHLTTAVYGTFGYLDPEYFQTSQLTEKSDVYSFGVVLAELLTGEKPISLARIQERRSLATYFTLSMEEGFLFDILDARVKNEGDIQEIMVVAELAKRCLELNGKRRPTMREVTRELEGVRKTFNGQENYEKIDIVRMEETNPCDDVSTPTQSILETSATATFDALPL